MKKGVFIVISIAIAASLVSGCLAPGSRSAWVSPSPTPTLTEGLTLRIDATPARYNPAMSSTIGIRLVAVNTSGILPPEALSTWETSYGTFYHWSDTDSRVVELAPDFTGGDTPVYWSYSLHGEKERPPVNITLTVTESGKVLGQATLRIGWEPPDGVTAIVEGPA